MSGPGALLRSAVRLSVGLMAAVALAGAATHAGPMLVIADPVVIPATVAELPLTPAERTGLTGADAVARREAAAVASGQAELYVGAHASRDRLITPRAAEARVIHLAVAAVWRDDDPAGSALVLAGADGLLTPPKIEALELHPDLVTLSRTPARPASEAAALAVPRAFLAAGARAVIAPRNPVDGPAAAAVMEALYAALRQGRTIEAALASADPRHDFVLLGAGDTTVPSLLGARTAVQTRFSGFRMAIGTVALMALLTLLLMRLGRNWGRA